MTEAAYDTEVAPLLKEAADRCLKLGMPFVAVCEYESGSRGRTAAAIGARDVDMQIINLAVQSGGNLDAFLIAVVRYVTQVKIEHSCVCLTLLGLPRKPEDRK